MVVFNYLVPALFLNVCEKCMALLLSLRIPANEANNVQLTVQNTVRASTTAACDMAFPLFAHNHAARNRKREPLYRRHSRPWPSRYRYSDFGARRTYLRCCCCCCCFPFPHVTTPSLAYFDKHNQFETQIKANISHANDWPTGDPDGLHDRPNLLGLVSTDDNEYLQIAATGIQTPIPELGPIITGTGTGDLPWGAFQSGESYCSFPLPRRITTE